MSQHTHECSWFKHSLSKINSICKWTWEVLDGRAVKKQKTRVCKWNKVAATANQCWIRKCRVQRREINKGKEQVDVQVCVRMLNSSSWLSSEHFKFCALLFQAHFQSLVQECGSFTRQDHFITNDTLSLTEPAPEGSTEEVLFNI